MDFRALHNQLSAECFNDEKKEIKITSGVAGSIWAMSWPTLSGPTIFIMTVRRRPSRTDATVPGKHLIVPLGSDSMNESLLKSIHCAV